VFCFVFVVVFVVVVVGFFCAKEAFPVFLERKVRTIGTRKETCIV
jgi:hypothetical protein